MRIIELTHPQDKRRFKMLHQALMMAPVKTSRNELLPLGNALAKLQLVGVKDPRVVVAEADAEEGDEPVPIYNLLPGSHKLKLEDAEHQVLKRYFEATIGSFPKPWALDVNATAEWLDKLPETKE